MSEVMNAAAGSDATRKRSPGDFCLNKRATYLDFDPRQAVPISDNHHQLRIELEHRAWVCPFCQQSTEYWLLNGYVIMGCGMASRFSNGKSSDCCGRWECQEAQDRFHADWSSRDTNDGGKPT